MKLKTLICLALTGSSLVANVYSCSFPKDETKQASIRNSYVKTTDLKKENLKGSVSRVEEKVVWENHIYNSTYSYNEQGMLLRSDQDELGTVVCEYDHKGMLVKRSIQPLEKEDGSFSEMEIDGRSFFSPAIQTFRYDENDRLTESYIGDAKTSYGYSNKGLLSKSVDEYNSVISFLYDDKGNLTKEWREEGLERPYRLVKYDENEQVIFEMNPEARLHFKYNDKGDVIHIEYFTAWDEEGTVLLFEYEYDHNGNWIIRRRTKPEGGLDNVAVRKIEYYE
ncbi:hypothetical protein [Dysgonomonas sp. 511]|uniref:hypothetical protein n=1 Tax=Dysgonomonas sp. 511 TaxID=2302930 RepID=UPI0013D647E3|nr:hypothetical protein [Dysgonomonas sp. 511]NDV78419.1 hypothetical protein [Dysgonomonas sp. 511]